MDQREIILKRTPMVDYTRMEGKDGGALGGLRSFLATLMEKGVVDAVMVPMRLPYKGVIMQTLVRDPAKLEGVDPMAPVVPTNSAKFAAQLTHDETGKGLALVMRPCEIRPFVELVKLKQGRLEEVLIIGLDCLGRYENADFLALDGANPAFTLDFYRSIRDGKGTARDGTDLAEACKACEHPVAEGADICICLIGEDIDKGLTLQGVTPKGKEALSKAGMDEAQRPDGREQALQALLRERTSFRDAWLKDMRDQTRDLEGLMDVLGNCINCYNCRVACPVCYCRECVFVTDTFQHDSEQYFRWAEKRGMLKLPTDTIFYHLTRMQHMSTLCVGCGQCTSVCPSHIPVSQLFRSVAEGSQRLFHYEPGRDVKEPLPLGVFYEKEFEEVAGGK
jgi:formate dehydrogenase subunit beta